ncbi:MAG: tetratricopeptide repeat protein, partial [Aquincola sp.]|nr:tetratricopeptide repeat protein [Aquincola sp.]
MNWLNKLRGGNSSARPPAPAPTQALPPDAATLVAEGNRMLDAGRPGDAARCYADALVADPQHLDAAVNLGFARMELGQMDAAAEILVGVVCRRPEHVDALFMLGTIAQARGDPTEAVERFEAAIRIQPGFMPARAPLVRALVTLNKVGRAAEVVDAGLAQQPREPELLFLRGNLNRVSGDVVGAIAAYRAALELLPQMVEARVPMGHLLLESGDVTAATRAFEQGLAHRPGTAELCTRLGDGLLGVGKVDAACAAYAMALERDARHTPALVNLSHAEITRGRYEAALAAAAQLTKIAPESAPGWINLGTANGKLDRPAEAAECFRRACELEPTNARPLGNLGVLALQRGAVGEALELLDRAVSLDPSVPAVQSDRLFVLTYLDAPRAYRDAARQYGALVAKMARPFADWPAQQDNTPPRLRVGLVSGDLRTHPVGFFVESVMPHLRAAGVDLVAFPTAAHEDEVSRRLMAHCAGWVPLASSGDEAAATRIRDERIHVLLDLAGHSGYDRLPIFAWRPAPVQASWLGYWASTGVEAIDYVIADPLSIRDGEEGDYVETVWRLPETRLCFCPPGGAESFPIGPLAALRGGEVTFGCYQNLAKVCDPVLAAWKRVLDAVPGARLRVQNRQTDRAGEAGLRARFEAAGIEAARLLLAPPTDRTSYLRSYAEVDLLL